MGKPAKRPFQASSIFLILGLVMFAIGAYSLAQYARFEAVAITTVGTVVRINTEHKRGGGRRRTNFTLERPVVRFENSTGTETTAIAAGSTTHHYQLGEHIDVKFDPAHPSTSLRVDNGPSWLDLGLGAMGLVFIVGGLAKPHHQRGSRFSSKKKGSGTPG